MIEWKVEGIKDLLTEKGFSEVINFPFTKANDEDKSIIIDNPLDSNRKNLRTHLKDSLIENLLYNERRQKESIKIYEISDVYHNENKIKQEKRLGIIISGKVDENYIDYSNDLDFEYLNKILNGDGEATPFIIEEISRDSIKTKKKNKIFYTEILIDDIPERFSENVKSDRREVNFIKFKQVPEFPSSKRDFSFSIIDPKKYYEVLAHIENFNNQNLKKHFIFDFYKNEKSGEIKLGVSLVFQSAYKTLSENEIQNTISILLKPITQLEGVSIPGLEFE